MCSVGVAVVLLFSLHDKCHIAALEISVGYFWLTLSFLLGHCLLLL